jgi:hypothetical protein
MKSPEDKISFKYRAVYVLSMQTCGNLPYYTTWWMSMLKNVLHRHSDTHLSRWTRGNWLMWLAFMLLINNYNSLTSKIFPRCNFLPIAKLVQLLHVPCDKPSELDEDPVCQDRTGLREQFAPPNNAWPQHFHPMQPNVLVCTPTHLGNSKLLVPISRPMLLWHWLHWNNQ